MALTVSDVITEDFVRDTVEEIVEADLVYRQVYDQISATGIQSNAYQFNVAEDDMGRVQVVPEGSEIPRTQSTVKEVIVNFDKYASEVSITMEAQEDGMIDMKAREIEDLARAMDERLNDEAYTELNSNYRATVGDSNDQLSFADIRDGVIGVRENNYSPDTIILDLDGYGDLLTDSNFNRATSEGDQVVNSGEIGEIAGMNVIVDNTHNIGDDNGGGAGNGAFVVDSSKFGFELTRTPIATNQYSDPERQADMMQIYTRKAWKAIFGDAAVRVDG